MADDDWPKITSRRAIPISPWMTVIERAVEFAPHTEPQLYHAVGQQDYIAIVALTPAGKIPIVRQYRPAIERFTWELPAGLVEKDEDAADTCRRELAEETGLASRRVHALGVYSPCSARLSNNLHSFFVETGPDADAHAGEPGIELKLVTLAELAGLVRSGEFVMQLHVGALMLAGMHGFIDLAAFAR